MRLFLNLIAFIASLSPYLALDTLSLSLPHLLHTTVLDSQRQQIC